MRLLLPDGRLADAEGVRTLAALCLGFGSSPDPRFVELRVSPAPPELAAGQRPMVDRIERRLRSLGWDQGLPEACDALQSPAAFARARRELKTWWPKWEAEGVLPSEVSVRPRSPARKAALR